MVRPIKPHSLNLSDIKKYSIYIVPVFLIIVATITFLIIRNQQDTRSRASEAENRGQIISGSRKADPRGSYVPGEILVKFKPGTKDEEKNNILNQHNAQVLEEISEIQVKKIKVPDQALEAVLKALQNNPAVSFAEENVIAFPDEVPGDPLYYMQWQHPSLNTPGGWDKAKASNILVGVCDTGFDANHPDLQPVLRADLGWNSADGSKNWSPTGSHGTSTAGLVAAATNNGIGVSGIAWGAQIIPVRVSNYADGSATADAAIKCITYAANNGARTINLSYRFGYSSSVDAAGQYAQSKGALTFVSAGNDGEDPGWVNNPGLIVVGATTKTDTKASFSNYGKFVDISAPGNSVYTTRLGGTYIAFSGTSASSPVAAGVGALIFGARPTLTAIEAQKILFESARDAGSAGYDTYFGWGVVNAENAVNKVLGTTSVADTTLPITSITSPPSNTIVRGNVSVNAIASDNVGISRVDLFYYDSGTCSGCLENFIGSSTTFPYEFNWDSTKAANGYQYLIVRAYDYKGNMAKTNIKIQIDNTTTPDTTPPIVSMKSPVEGSTITGSIVIQANASDAETGIKNVIFYLDGISLGSASKTTTGYIEGWNTTLVSNGTHTIQARATDLAGNISNSSVSFSVNNGIDTTTPTTSITSPVNGSGVTEGITITSTATDNIGVTKVEFLVDGVLKMSDTSSPYSYFWDTSQYTNGTHSLMTRAYDAAGNTGISPIINVTVNNIPPTPLPTPSPTNQPTPTPTRSPTPTSSVADTTGPIITISSPVDGLRATSNVRIQASASDNVAVVRMEIYIDNVLKTSSGGSSITSNWNVKSKSITNGSHTIMVKAYDAAGNIGSRTISVIK